MMGAAVVPTMGCEVQVETALEENTNFIHPNAGRYADINGGPLMFRLASDLVYHGLGGNGNGLTIMGQHTEVPNPPTTIGANPVIVINEAVVGGLGGTGFSGNSFSDLSGGGGGGGAGNPGSVRGLGACNAVDGGSGQIGLAGSGGTGNTDFCTSTLVVPQVPDHPDGWAAIMLGGAAGGYTGPNRLYIANYGTIWGGGGGGGGGEDTLDPDGRDAGLEGVDGTASTVLGFKGIGGFSVEDFDDGMSAKTLVYLTGGSGTALKGVTGP